MKGEISGFAFRTSLFPTGKGDHIMLVNKRMQSGGKAVPGTVAQFRLEPDTEARVVTVPAELKRALGEDRSLRRWFDRLNYSTRKEIADWITQVKSGEARLRRAEQIAERLLATWKPNANCRPFCRWRSSGTLAVGKDGSACHRRAGGCTCSVSSIIGTPKRALAGSPRCFRTPPS